MYRLYRKMTIYRHFSIKCIHFCLDTTLLGSDLYPKPSYNEPSYKVVLVYKHTDTWFVCVGVLRPSQPDGVMSSAVSLPNHTFTGQA